MHYKLLTLAILALFHADCFAQTEKDTLETRCTTVIAVNGLNIREKPNRLAKVIGKIPFGQKIKYLSKYAFGVDTIRDYPHIGGVHHYRPEKDELFGKWAKISYKGKIGYVNDAYLFYDQESKALEEADRRDYALLYSYYNCFINIYTPSKFLWYGLFQAENGRFYLRKVKINYFSVPEKEFGGKDFGASLGDDRGLVAIIGSKKPMKEGQRTCIDLDKLRNAKDQELDTIQLKKYGIERLTGPAAKQYDPEYLVRSGNQTQLLTAKPDGKTRATLSQILFIGDIDGDQKIDYILSTDAESGHHILFLSTERKGSHLVEPVAYFFVCYCC